MVIDENKRALLSLKAAAEKEGTPVALAGLKLATMAIERSPYVITYTNHPCCGWSGSHALHLQSVIHILAVTSDDFADPRQAHQIAISITHEVGHARDGAYAGPDAAKGSDEYDAIEDGREDVAWDYVLELLRESNTTTELAEEVERQRDEAKRRRETKRASRRFE